MAISKDDDKLGTTAEAGYSTAWDYKNDYVSRLHEDGYERFSQFSATPDTTVLFAGPARFTGLGGNTAALLPIGLVDGIQYQNSPQLQRMFEIGSNRSFFTRGKSAGTISFSQILADQANILKALTTNAYRPEMNISGSGAPGPESPNPDIMMNLDSEYFSVPFGLMLLMKTRGGNGGAGKILSASYLEYCMFSGFQFSIASQSPVIMQNIGVEFDRLVPISLAN